jgi:hypothetical protein
MLATEVSSSCISVKFYVEYGRKGIITDGERI